MTVPMKRLCLVLLCLAPGVAGKAFGDDEIRIDNAGLATLEEATVSAEEAGPLVDLPAKEGMQVSRDDLLARLKDTEAQLQVEQASIDVHTAEQLATDDTALRLAQKELELALSDLARNEHSNKQLPNSVPEARLERLRLVVARERLKVEKAQQDRKLAQIALEGAQTRLKIAEARLARRSLRAPIAGTVVEVLRRKGEWVQVGEPLVRILQHDRLRTEAYIDAKELKFAAEGMPVVFQADVPAFGPQEFRGEVTFVSPEANPVNGEVRVVAEINNRDHMLRPGYLGTLVVQRSAGRGVPHASR
jgi:multidrug resistance efflux pump